MGHNKHICFNSHEECFFGVNFADGRIKCYPTKKGKGYFTRYVRGEFIDNDFIDENDGTVLDKTSGLIWQKTDSGKGMDWKEALHYCENLILGGYDDWRLPSAKELQYLVDYSRSPDTTNSPAINPLFEVSIIINEAGQKDYPYFWTSTTHINHNNAMSAVYISFGRALGYMNGRWMDVHGTGAQRSDPKTGDPNDYPTGFGPKGDARRIYNYARCVRNGAEFIEVKSEAIKFGSEQPVPQSSDHDRPLPPQEAINACGNEGSKCSFTNFHGTITGTCRNIDGTIACVP